MELRALHVLSALDPSDPSTVRVWCTEHGLYKHFLTKILRGGQPNPVLDSRRRERGCGARAASTTPPTILSEPGPALVTINVSYQLTTGDRVPWILYTCIRNGPQGWLSRLLLQMHRSNYSKGFASHGSTHREKYATLVPLCPSSPCVGSMCWTLNHVCATDSCREAREPGEREVK